MANPKPDMTIAWGEDGTNIVKPTDSKIQAGWIAEKPTYQAENWIQNRTDEYLKHIDENGVPAWAVQSAYGLGSFCLYNNQLWESIQAANTGNIPDDALGWWQSWQPLDKKRGGEVSAPIILGTLAKISGRYADGKLTDLLTIDGSDNVSMGAIVASNITAPAPNVSIYHSSNKMIEISDSGVEFLGIPKTAIDPVFDDDLVRKGFLDASIYTAANLSLGSSISLSNPFPGPPSFMQIFAKCIVPEQGYSVNDILALSPGTNNVGSSGNSGVAISATSSSIWIRPGSATAAYRAIVAGGSGASFTLNHSNWTLTLRAWR